MEHESPNEIAREAAARLREAYGSRLRGVVLYGSEARGEARDDSDVDMLVFLSGPVALGRDLETNLRALYPISKRLERRVSALPVEEGSYENLDCPLFRRAHEEGIRA